MSSTFITLKNGEQVKVNDHVYCSPSWSVRDGTPYSVARIMEFLPPEGTSRNPKNRPNYTRVRLAWYYRPGDVSDRPVADSRLLLAAIFSEITDISQLRSKCFVVHRDKITDLAGWKKRPDRFYFNRLFDPYIKKEFEVIQAVDVRNLPANIRDVLISRYEYVVAEKEIVPDLTDALRNCETCQKWCPPPECVRCDRCKRYFHMGCVQPPLIAKPTRGYGWTCAPCSRAHEEAVEGHVVGRHSTPVTKPRSNAPPARGRGRPRKDKSLAEKEEMMEVKHFKMWPFRYFGLHTVAEDTIDPDDLIFPRTTTRLGPKYQVVVPPLRGPNDEVDKEERGGDSTVEVLGLVCHMSEEQVAAVEAKKEKLARNIEELSSVDWLTEFFHRVSIAFMYKKDLATYQPNMRDQYSVPKWKNRRYRYSDLPWDDEDRQLFEEGIQRHGAELRTIALEVIRTRTTYEVVRYYGHWKAAKIKEEYDAKRKNPSSVASTPYSKGADSDDEGSIIRSVGKNFSCGACRTKESHVWWKAPRGLSSNVLCDNCGLSWRKYADLNHMRPVREEVLAKTKTAEKREGTPLNAPSNKRLKTTGSVGTSPTPAAPSAPQMRCAACHKNGPAGKVIKCQQCQMKIHAGACGYVPDANTTDWTCDLCQNEKVAEASLNTDCVLCPRPRRDRKSKEYYPLPDTFLRICKPTEGQGWAHALCSVFHPEVMFSDAKRLRVVEGISAIPPVRWQTRCALCKESGGAVVKCHDCPQMYHASCAWNKGFKFQFDIQPAKSARRDSTIINWKDYPGVMIPIVRCKEHHEQKHQYINICDMNTTGQTALQTYCQEYKQVQVSQSHALLRKAQRLDEILLRNHHHLAQPPHHPVTNGHAHTSPPPSVHPLTSSTNSNTTSSTLAPRCCECKTSHTPFMHAVGSRFMCHRCWFEKELPTYADPPTSLL